MWLLFFFLIFVLLLISLLIERDFFAPATLLNGAYLLAIFLAMIRAEDWNFDIHSETICVIFLGNFIFLLTIAITNILFKKRKIKSELRVIKYDESILNIIMLTNLIMLSIYTFYFLKMFAGLSFGNFYKLISYYSYHKEIGDNFPLVIAQFPKWLRATAYISVYIIIHNKLIDKKWKTNWKLLFLIMLYLPIPILSAGRFDLMILFIFAIVYYMLLRRFILGEKILKPQKIVKFIILIFVGMVAFTNMASLVGRTYNSGLINYISGYFGGPLKAFDYYIYQNGLSSVTNEFGPELFAGIKKLLEQFGFISNAGVGSETIGDFVILVGDEAANVYTAYRNVIHDFGITLLPLFSVIHGFVINKIYRKAKRGSLESIFVYSILCFTVILHPFSEFFYSKVLSFNYLVFFICLFVIEKVLIRQTHKV